MEEPFGPATQAKENLQRFPCGQCGAKLDFKPGTDALVCPYCDFSNPIPKSEEDIEELDFRAHLAHLAEEAEVEENVSFHCDTCGATATMDDNVTSDSCPFCGANVVLKKGSTRQLKPKSLLPFKIDRAAAAASFRKWVKGLWFAPSKVKHANAEGRLRGMYIPYWTYDSDTTSYYRGERGDDYWDTETYTTTENGKTVTKTRRVRKTRWTRVSGTVWNQFDDVLIVASNSLPKAQTNRLEPWDLENLTPYDDKYLSGFRAESYQVGLEDGFAEAQKIMDGAIRQSICRDIGGDHQRIHSVKTQYDNVTFKHILLPIWLDSYRFGKKVYRFLVNGRTGEAQGERPWSWIKITAAILAALAIAGIVIALTR